MRELESAIGVWWVETDPGHRVPGYIELAPDEPSFPWRLTIDGQLYPKLPLGVDQTVTIFGDTPAGEFTLEHASRRSWLSRDSGERVMQQWRGFRLLDGGHLESGAVLNWAAFRLPHLWNWFGPTSLNKHSTNLLEPAADSAEDTEWFDAELVDGMKLSLGRVKATSFEAAGRRSTTHWIGTYSVTSKVGFTKEQLHTVCDGMAKLHSLVTSIPI
ncbi:hypothetical protein ACFWEJ_02600, partial [Promicromonospora sp. NPDC060204]|uniref:ApeA N-terminal domain 1-containing protein n=1 Tax=Promicromonospora sp. NPDC060204 TaxID=3347071 RepID=UPI003663B633